MSTLFNSYEQQGEKLSFANWISMISPEDTPFVSMTGKESINEIMFSWQTDRLAAVNPNNAAIEGSQAVVDTDDLFATNVKNGYCQILRKAVTVSDTANAISAYGRGRELQYQMEKAGRAIKRDLETILLSDQVGGQGSNPTAATPTARLCDGFASTNLIATGADPDTTAVVRQVSTDYADFESALFGLTLNLYTAGADCDVIMVNPALANTIAQLQENDGTRLRMFENTKQFIKQVNSITDPLGQTFKVVINRWMPADKVYVFNASDWTQMVLRAPKRVQLAKTGSAENWMIEMEVGLRHRNPYASGILDTSGGYTPVTPSTVSVTADNTNLKVGDKATATAKAKA